MIIYLEPKEKIRLRGIKDEKSSPAKQRTLFMKGEKMPEAPSTIKKSDPPVYVLSCGQGINGEQLIRSALVQFKDSRCRVVKIPNLTTPELVTEAIKKVEDNAVIAHTLVDPESRACVKEACAEREIISVDLMGDSLRALEAALGSSPAGEPGRYRRFNQINMDRVAAIEFTVAHDDGLNPQDLHEAEIVLVGLSRSGKTPLSMYLSVHGWMVANIPIVIDIPLPEELLAINRKRIVALYIDPEQLTAHRQIRKKRLGILDDDGYSGKREIYREVDAVRELYRKYGFATINVSNKPIESSAEEVIAIIEKRFPRGAHKLPKKKLSS